MNGHRIKNKSNSPGQKGRNEGELVEKKGGREGGQVLSFLLLRNIKNIILSIHI